MEFDEVHGGGSFQFRVFIFSEVVAVVGALLDIGEDFAEGVDVGLGHVGLELEQEGWESGLLPG